MMNGVGIMDETHLKALNQTLVSFENIHHKYGKITSVEDISFQIQHGEIVSLLGLADVAKQPCYCLLLVLKPVCRTYHKKQHPDFISR